MTLKLAAPWTVFYRQLQALFKEDSEVKVIFDEENSEIKLYVDNQTKANALSQLLPRGKEFGNVNVDINIIPGNKEKQSINLVHDAFDDNTSVAFIYELENVFGDKFNFVLFNKEVIQFFNDNILDVHGVCSTLMENIAREVLDPIENIFYCTDIDKIDILGFNNF